MDPSTLFIAAAGLGLGALFTSLRVLWEYERGVIFRLGKLTRAKGPGLIFLVPFGLERMRKMDLRIVALDQMSGGNDIQESTSGQLEDCPPDAASAIIKDETVCIRCGLCAERCPSGAITMERLSFEEKPTCRMS